MKKLFSVDYLKLGVSRRRKKLSSLVLVLLLVSGIVFGSGYFRSLRAQWEMAIGWAGVVGTALAIYSLIQSLHQSSYGYVIDLNCPGSPDIHLSQNKVSVPSRIEAVYPGRSYLYDLSTPGHKGFRLKIDSQFGPLRGYPEYEVCLSEEFFQMIREEGEKKVQVMDDRDKIIFNLTVSPIGEDEQE